MIPKFPNSSQNIKFYTGSDPCAKFGEFSWLLRGSYQIQMGLHPTMTALFQSSPLLGLSPKLHNLRKCMHDPYTSHPSLLGWMRENTVTEEDVVRSLLPTPPILRESRRKRCQKVTFFSSFFFVFTTGVSHWVSSFQVAVSLLLGRPWCKLLPWV